MSEAQTALLALSVAGRPLTHGHGAPARLLVPDHRGFDWVKWVSRISVRGSPDIWQPPLPLQ
jgi:DMSO/TMAO reductase YedYZ molybdopterin-dependent catalytic subunit